MAASGIPCYETLFRVERNGVERNRARSGREGGSGLAARG